jgi:hypothetical protein
LFLLSVRCPNLFCFKEIRASNRPARLRASGESLIEGRRAPRQIESNRSKRRELPGIFEQA